MVQDQEVAGSARPTAAERLEITRTRLLDAVIESLAEVGYAATSTTEVARRSGLTRGAQLHHFGTKDQMLLAAVEHLNSRGNADQILAALDQLSDGERLHAALAVLSRFAEGPYPAAYAELWLASRAHPELEPALREADVNARESVRSLFGPTILAKAGPEFDTLLDFTMYALRGMALDAHFSSREERDARRAIILGLEKYLLEAMKQPRKKH